MNRLYLKSVEYPKSIPLPSLRQVRRIVHNLPMPSFSFDRVRLVSSASKSRLRRELPTGRPKHLSPKFRVLTDGHRAGWVRSAIECGGQAPDEFWAILLKHKAVLWRHQISILELAYDFPAAGEDEAIQTCIALGVAFRKRWHQRGEVRVEYDPLATPPPGLLPGPTVYFEHRQKKRQTRTGIKIYSRHAKTPNGGFDGAKPICRLEFTLAGAAAIKEKTGISSIDDLREFDGAALFLDRHLRLETLNLKRFGKWLDPKANNPASVAKRYLKDRAFDEWQAEIDEARTWDTKDLDEMERKITIAESKEGLINMIWQSSSHVRGFLRAERKDMQHRRGRRNSRERRFAQLTDYQINTFFDPIDIDVYE